MMRLRFRVKMLYLLGMIGPRGEKRPGDVIANAVLADRFATGEAEEEYVDQEKRPPAKRGPRPALRS